jgi:hypothetical protein
MRLTAVVFAATLMAAPTAAQPPQPTPPSSPSDSPSTPQDATKEQAQKKDQGRIDDQGERTQGQERGTKDLPVSLDKIKHALEQPPVQTLRGLDEKPHFKIEIRERQKFTLEELIKSMDFKSGPVPAGGLYGFEQQRQMFPAVDNPLHQPYAAFSQGELLTILIENLVGKYLAGRAANMITAAERSRAEAAARDEAQRAIAEYCAAQPRGGAGIQICDTSNR